MQPKFTAAQLAESGVVSAVNLPTAGRDDGQHAASLGRRNVYRDAIAAAAKTNGALGYSPEVFAAMDLAVQHRMRALVGSAVRAAGVRRAKSSRIHGSQGAQRIARLREAAMARLGEGEEGEDPRARGGKDKAAAGMVMAADVKLALSTSGVAENDFYRWFEAS